MLWSIDTYQNKVFDHIACLSTEIARVLKFTAIQVLVLIGSRVSGRLTGYKKCPVVRKLVNDNPGFIVNGNITFSCIQMFFNTFVLCSLTEIIQSKNRKPHRKVTKLKSKFSLNKRILDLLRV